MHRANNTQGKFRRLNTLGFKTTQSSIRNGYAVVAVDYRQSSEAETLGKGVDKKTSASAVPRSRHREIHGKKQVDMPVYKLCNLTAEEIAVVEGK